MNQFEATQKAIADLLKKDANSATEKSAESKEAIATRQALAKFSRSENKKP
jgi:hypothetical protein